MTILRPKSLLGDTSRAKAGLTLAACVIVVAVAGLSFKGQTAPDSFDNAVDSPVISFLRGHGDLLTWLVVPGTLIPAVTISAAIAAGCLIARRLNGAVLAAVVVPAATGLNDGVLKHLFHRTYLGALSFPSGHTACVTGIAATLAILLLVPPQQERTRRIRWVLVAVACLIAAVVAMGVIGLRWHYFTDTVAGGAVGVGTALALALLLDLGTGIVSRPRRGNGALNLADEPAAKRRTRAAPAE